MPVPMLKTAITNGRPVRPFSVVIILCSLLLHTLISLPCLSQTIGNWAFTNSSAGTGGMYNTVSAADFSAGIPTRAFNASSEYYGEGGWPAGALDPNAYVQFSLTPNAGYQLDLSSITLRLRRSNTGSPAGSGPTSWSLRSSVDGYSTNIASNSLTHTHTEFTIPLGATFHNQYTTITFRLYGYNATVNSGGLSRVVMDNISVQGIGEVLPLNLTGIQALRNNEKDITVKWQISNVQEGTMFNVLRSVNGVDFTTLTTLTEKEYKASNSYTYLDDRTPAISQPLYYRVQGVLASGRTFLSPIVKVTNKAATQALIEYTSIQGQSLLTALQIPERGVYGLSIAGFNGALLQQRSIELDAGVHVIILPLNALPHGAYVVRLANSKAGNSRKFVLVR
jgi:hypothetical protein